MSDADRVALSYIVESTFGETPTTPALQKLRFTSESLKQTTGTVTSQEIRDDREVSDIIRTDRSVSGDLGVEFSYGSYDDFKEAALQGTWTTTDDTSVTAATISVDGSGVLLDSADGLGSFDRGDFIRVTGFTDSSDLGDANNGTYVVLTAAIGAITVEGGFPELRTAGDTVTILEANEVLSNGVTDRSFTIQKEFVDIANNFVVYNGVTIEGWSMNITPTEIITGGFTFLGKIATSASSAISGSSSVAATETSVFNAIDNVRGVVNGTDRIGTTGVSLALVNNQRLRNEIATLGPISIGSGQLNITGTLQAYLANSTLMDKYLDFDTTSLVVSFRDELDQSYCLQLPSIKFTDGERTATGLNQDVISNMTFSTRRDQTNFEALTATIAGGGTSYTAGDDITLVGGTGTAAIFNVDTESAGVITAVTVIPGSEGFYTAIPTNPVSVTGGTGSGATLTVTFDSGTSLGMIRLARWT